jgi:hypothetical protein
MGSENLMVEIECTAAGLQIPGCGRGTLPKSPSHADWQGQGLLGFYVAPTLQEEFALLADAPLTAKRGQKAPPRSDLFRT